MQLSVPLRKFTLKSLFLPLVRAPEYAFTFGSSTSTFFQLHIVNCTALGEEKVKAAVATLRLERCKSADGHQPHWKRVRTANLSVACKVLGPLSSFAFYDLDCFPLVLDCSWFLASTYIRYSMTCGAYFLFIILLLKEIIVRIRAATWHCLLFYIIFALLKLLSFGCWWSAKFPTAFKSDRTQCSWSPAGLLNFPRCYHFTLHCLINGLFSGACFIQKVVKAQQVESLSPFHLWSKVILKGWGGIVKTVKLVSVHLNFYLL